MKALFNNLLAVWVVGFAVAMPSVARADFGAEFKGGQDRPKMEERIQAIYAQLDLSDEQKKMLADNKARHKSAKENLSTETKAAMQALGDELKKKDLDMPRIESLRARMKMLREQMSDERFNAILEVRKILTQEQFLKFSDLMEQQK
jgi:protein CpxP